MNDTTKAVTEFTPRQAPAVAQAAQHAPMPTALALYLDDALYERVSSIASRMSKAQGVTPKHLVGQPEACFAVVSRAITWKLDPFAVAMATYQTPGGQIGFEGKLVHAIIENSGRLDPAGGGIKYEHYGDWSKVQGKFAIIEKQKDDGKKTSYAVPRWTDDDARSGKPTDQVKYPVAQSCGVRLIAQVRGESAPRMLDFDLIQAQPRNSTLWATDPMTQICYTAVRRFGSLVASSLMMGVPFDPVDHFAPPGEVDVSSLGGEIAMPRATDEPAKKDAPMDVDPATGEVNAREPMQSDPPAGETKAEAGETKAATGEGDTGKSDTSAGASSKGDAPLGKKASDAQRKMLMDMAKRGGLTVAQLDEHLVEKYSMGIDELPMGLVSKATELIRSLASSK